MRRLALLSVIWGWSFVFIKVAGRGLTPPTVAAARVALGAAVLAPLAWRRGWRPAAMPWSTIAVVALFSNALPFTALAWGEQRTSSALSAVLNASTPFFTAAVAVPLLRDTLRTRQVVGLLVGAAGVALAAGLGSADLAGTSPAGIAAPVGAAASYGVGICLARRSMTSLPALHAASSQLLAATAWSTPFALWSSAVGGVSATPEAVASILALGLVGTGAAYVLYFGLINDLGATRTATVTYLVPVVAVVVGMLVLDEPFSWRLVAGGIVVVAGVRLVTTTPRSVAPESVAA